MDKNLQQLDQQLENFVYAFPELNVNKIIVKKGEKITKIDFNKENLNRKVIPQYTYARIYFKNSIN